MMMTTNRNGVDYMKKITMKVVALMLVLITLLSVPLSASALDVEAGKEIAEDIVRKSTEKLISAAADQNNATRVLGGIGQTFFGTFMDSIGFAKGGDDALNEQIDEAQQEIDAKFVEINSHLADLHTETMQKLGSISDQIKLLQSSTRVANFKDDYKSMVDTYTMTMKALHEYSAYISYAPESDSMPTIDHNTYETYTRILNDCNPQNSAIDTMENMRMCCSGESFYCGEQPAFIMIADCYMLAAKVNSADGQTLTKADIDAILDTLEEFEANTVMHYTVCLQLEKMQYDCKNYRYNHHGEQYTIANDSYREANMGPYTKEIGKLSDKMNEIDGLYQNAVQYLNGIRDGLAE